VVEVQFDLNVGVDSRFITGELELFNKVFVRTLSETTTFISVQVDVVNEKTSTLERRNAEQVIASGKRGSAFTKRIFVQASDVALGLVAELKVDSDFVILQSNKRKSKTRVAAEPELKRNIKSSFRKIPSWLANITYTISPVTSRGDG